ncbi:hypothetical protein ABK040_001557 [Willaertia magna]
MYADSLKCVTVGDGAVGKTMMLMAYAYGRITDDCYIPTVFDNYTACAKYKDNIISLGLWDTAGQEEYDRVRPIAYTDTDVFIVAFSIVSPISFANCKIKWIPEVKHYSEDTPIVLVRTKKDLVYNSEVLSELHLHGKSFVTEEEAMELVEEEGCYCYVECSSMTMFGIKEVFQNVVIAAIDKKERVESKQQKRKHCQLL